MDQTATEISKLNTRLDAIEKLLEKDYEEWTLKEKQKFGNHKQLRKKEEQLMKKEEQLMKKEEQLRELLILKEKEKQQLQGIASQITAGTALDSDNSTVIRTPFKLEAVYTNEGVAGVFRNSSLSCLIRIEQSDIFVHTETMEGG
jgi:predicted ATPase